MILLKEIWITIQSFLPLTERKNFQLVCCAFSEAVKYDPEYAILVDLINRTIWFKEDAQEITEKVIRWKDVRLLNLILKRRQSFLPIIRRVVFDADFHEGMLFILNLKDIDRNVWYFFPGMSKTTSFDCWTTIIDNYHFGANERQTLWWIKDVPLRTRVMDYFFQKQKRVMGELPCFMEPYLDTKGEIDVAKIMPALPSMIKQMHFCISIIPFVPLEVVDHWLPTIPHSMLSDTGFFLFKAGRLDIITKLYQFSKLCVVNIAGYDLTFQEYKIEEEDVFLPFAREVFNGATYYIPLVFNLIHNSSLKSLQLLKDKKSVTLTTIYNCGDNLDCYFLIMIILFLLPRGEWWRVLSTEQVSLSLNMITQTIREIISIGSRDSSLPRLRPHHRIVLDMLIHISNEIKTFMPCCEEEVKF